jgi:hypothetical protein
VDSTVSFGSHAKRCMPQWSARFLTEVVGVGVGLKRASYRGFDAKCDAANFKTWLVASF